MGLSLGQALNCASMTLTPGRGAGFTPASLSGLRQWHEADRGAYADRGTRPAGNGEGVAQWDDLSGNGNHLTQTLSSARPVLATGARNGLAALTFDGVNDWLVNPNLSEPATIIAVHRPTNVAADRTLAGADTPDGVLLGAYYLKAGDPTVQAAFARATTETGNSTVASVLPPDLNSWTVFGGQSDATMRTIRTFNGLAQVGQDVVSPSAFRSIGGAGAVVGAGYYNDAVTDHFEGLLAALVVYDRILTLSEYRQVVGYLNAKYDE